jgi:hypothetical protein
VDVRLRTDSPALRAFFLHAYRWFPPAEGLRGLDLTALLDPRVEGGPSASAGPRRVSLAGSASPVNRAFLVLLDALMQDVDGSVILHGAAAARGDAGLILAGPALAGKTTLVLELLRLGFDFLSDDAAPLDRATGLILPFPRAVGMRKGVGGRNGRAPAVPDGALLDLPHKWLVDPEALGARLPAQPRRPACLFYLDPWPDGAPDVGRTFELATEGPSESVRRDLAAIGIDGLAEIPGRPFRTWRFRTPPDGGCRAAALSDLFRRHRGTILYFEEVRGEARRTGGDPAVRPARASSLLLPLVRDVLNRAEGGRLMAAHAGRLTSLVAELAGLLETTRCYTVRPGSPERTARALAAVAGEGGGA